MYKANMPEVIRHFVNKKWCFSPMYPSFFDVCFPNSRSVFDDSFVITSG